MFKKLRLILPPVLLLMVGCRLLEPDTHESTLQEEPQGGSAEVIEKVAFADGSSIEFIVSDHCVIISADGAQVGAEALRMRSTQALNPAELFKTLTGEPAPKRLIDLAAALPAGADATSEPFSNTIASNDFIQECCVDPAEHDYAECKAYKTNNREFEFRGYFMRVYVQLVEGDDLEILAQEYDGGTWQTHMKQRFSGEGTVKSVEVYADGAILGWFPNDDLRIKIVDADGNQWHASVYGDKEIHVLPSAEIDGPDIGRTPHTTPNTIPDTNILTPEGAPRSHP